MGSWVTVTNWERRSGSELQPTPLTQPHNRRKGIQPQFAEQPHPGRGYDHPRAPLRTEQNLVGDSLHSPTSPKPAPGTGTLMSADE